MRKSKMIRTGVLALILACAGAAAFAKTVETTMQSGKKVSTSIPNSNDRFEYKMDVRSAGTVTVKLDMSSVNFDVFFLLEKDIGNGFRKDHLQGQGKWQTERGSAGCNGNVPGQIVANKDKRFTGTFTYNVTEPGDSIKLLSGTWKSSNPSVIVISKKGKATAVGEGTATLTSSTGQKLVIKVEED